MGYLNISDACLAELLHGKEGDVEGLESHETRIAFEWRGWVEGHLAD